MSKKLTLKEPIKFGEDTITELEFRKAKAKDLRKLPTNPSTGDVIDLAGRLCNQPPRVMDELGIDDLMEVMEVVSDFLPVSRQTGKSASEA